MAQARALSVVTNPGIGGTSIDRFTPRWYGEDSRFAVAGLHVDAAGGDDQEGHAHGE